MDLVKKDVVLPQMNIGEWFVFREMGAYTIAAASTFNGFQLPSIKYHLPSHTLEAIRDLPCWPRLARVLGLEEESPVDVLDMSPLEGFDVVEHHMEIAVH
jgi:hypothetical protein